MERTLLKELDKKSLTAYINRAREIWMKRMYYSNFFGLKFTTQLTWESLSGSGGSPVMADVVEYNGTVPVKDRRVITKTSGDIPKIAMKKVMDEKDYNDYLTMKARAMGNSNKNALLDLIFDDVEAVYIGALARTEFLCLQALSYGKLSLTNTNNIGIITKTAVDFGVPADNKTAVGTIWATAATATPLLDLNAKVKAAKSNGHKVSNIIMDGDTFDLMVATDEAKETFAAFRGVTSQTMQFLMLQEINMFMTKHRLPPIQIVDSSVRFEGKNHAKTAIDTWKTGYVALVTDLKVGNVKHGPIAEEEAKSVSKKAITYKKDHVYISKFSNLEPFEEVTKCQANAFPTFNDVDSIYLLKTNGTSWS